MMHDARLAREGGCSDIQKSLREETSRQLADTDRKVTMTQHARIVLLRMHQFSLKNSLFCVSIVGAVAHAPTVRQYFSSRLQSLLRGPECTPFGVHEIYDAHALFTENAKMDLAKFSCTVTYVAKSCPKRGTHVFRLRQ